MAMRPLQALDAARGQLLPFAAMAMGIGIGLWFAWPQEPGPAAYGLAGGAGLALVGLWLWGPWALRPLAAFAAMLAAGFLAAGLRAQVVASLMLEFRY